MYNCTNYNPICLLYYLYVLKEKNTVGSILAEASPAIRSSFESDYESVEVAISTIKHKFLDIFNTVGMRVDNVTKDFEKEKESIVAGYEARIQTLQERLTSSNQNLETAEEAVKALKKSQR
ncbi:hypothetical protein ACFVR2_22960 [Gottfriedia sp. NPDC057991]|uniref:hypothetical protein n=1 Tax=Gottfriedia sp. NPDC057991 TaxID=3346298 RepID=UPI0036D7E1DC